MTIHATSVGFVRSFFSEHLLAKLFALILASGTVFLIDRELRSTWLQGVVEVKTAVEARSTSATTHRLVLDPEGEVAIIEDESHPLPTRLNLKIVGAKRDEQEFRKRFDITVKVKRSWLSSSTALRSHVLEKEDLDVGVRGAEIALFGSTEERTIWLDAFVDVPEMFVDFRLVAERVPAGFLVDEDASKLNPPTIRIRGPRTVVEPLQRQGILELDLESATTYVDGATYSLTLPPELTRRQVGILGTKPKVALRFKRDPKHDATEVELIGVEVAILMSRELLREIDDDDSIVEFQRAVMACKVRVKIPPGVRGERDLEETVTILNKQVRAWIDLTGYHSLGDLENASERPKIRVSGLLPGCETLKIDPDEFPVAVKRKN